MDELIDQAAPDARTITYEQWGLDSFREVISEHSEEVQVELEAPGPRASMLQRVADIEGGEVRPFVAWHAATEPNKPEIRGGHTIDMSDAICQAWASIAPDSRRPDVITADLNEAQEQEIREHDETLVGEPDGADPTPS